MNAIAQNIAEQVVSLEKDRDDWKAIAEQNADIIDRLRAEIDNLVTEIEDRDLEEAAS